MSLIPNITRLTIPAATAMLISDGFVLGTKTKTFNSLRRGLIVSQDPLPGLPGTPGEAVNVAFSIGSRSNEVIDPRFCTVQEWTDSMNYPLIDKSKVPRLDNPDAWREWAMHVVQSGKLSALNPPDPRFYDDWRTWAFDFIKVTA